MSSVAVMGIGFGDEGKGATTDWLAGRVDPLKSMVVRFSGGAQSGHTVVTDRLRHVFSQFGSGTLRGLPTYYSRFCTFDPLAFYKERTVLDSKGVGFTTYWLNKYTPVVTPMDIMANRGDLRSLANGTVGSGHGATLAREEAHYSLLAGDLLYPDVWREKLNLIEAHYTQNRWFGGSDGRGLAKAPVHLDDFREVCGWLVRQPWVRVTDASPRHVADTLIFEGSQGLLLDEDIGFFPHVTRGHTDTRHLRNLMDGREVDSYYLVTRGYHTRHGNGPLPWEGFGIEVSEYEGETNVTHEYQGAFRRAPLNVALLAYGLDKDPNLGGLTRCRSERVNLVVTCLDRMKEHVYVGNGSPTYAQTEKQFLGNLSALLGIPRVYANRAADAGSLQEVTW
jgi:adenylosuccinate synthase